MVQELQPDICVIGAGSAGLSLAAGAAQFGLDVVLVEKGRMGGDCLNYGCVPSKALIAAAGRARLAATAGGFGIGLGAPEIDFAAVMRHVRRTIADIAPNDSASRFRGLGVTVIEAEARFSGPRRIDAGDYAIAARHFVVATGAGPVVPPIAGLAETPFLTNETVFELTERPDHLVVLGGGPIGVELAQAFCRLGARVTVAEAQSALGRDDAELAAVVLDRLQAEGVELRQGARVTAVEFRRDRFNLTLETDTGTGQISGSHLLVATGRAPATAGLGLEEAGIEYSRRGIVVDRALRTTSRRVYAIGDVVGREQFTHVANYHAGLVLRSILTRWPHRLGEAAVPWVTYTDPELAWVGPTLEEARQRHRQVRIMRWPMAENDRARAERETGGMVKLVTDRRGRLIAGGIVAAGAGDLIQPLVLAITERLGVKALTGMIVPYPTRGEVVKRAAYGYWAPILLKSRLPGLARFLVRHF
jgi:pyruvate/2-oxoglutarate dehydrogenase complex dihydrolipoamide dehydrogenase (E3) component